MTKHTQIPWTASEANWGQFSVGPDDNVIATTYSLGSNGNEVDAKANTEFIAVAVNNHYRLIEALVSAEQQIEYLHEKFKPTGSGNNVLAQIDIALTAAGRNDR